MPPIRNQPKKRNAKPKRPPITKPRMVSVPAARSSVIVRKPPAVSAVKDGLRIRHRELVYTFARTGNFQWTVRSIPINPGLPSSFPWLSGTARNFEQYRINSLSYDYVPISATSVTGSAVMAIDYDPRDNEVNSGITRELMMQNSAAVSSPVWSHATLKGNTASLMGGTTRKFVRVYDVDSTLSTSIRSSDAGDFLIGVFTDSFGDTNYRTFGDVWVEYDITLMNPQPNIAQPGYFRTLQTGVGDAVTLINSFPTKVSTAFTEDGALVKDSVKVTGGLVANTTSFYTDPWNVKFIEFMQDLVPGAYYWVTAGVNEAGVGVSDILTFENLDAAWTGIRIVSSAMNRLTTTGGGTSATIRTLIQATADVAQLVYRIQTSGGGSGPVSRITGSMLNVEPSADLSNPFVPP